MRSPNSPWSAKTRQIIEPRDERAASSSWWIVDPERFYENAAKERARLRGSKGEKLAQQVLSNGAEKYLGKLGG